MEYIKHSKLNGQYTAFLNGGCLNYQDEKGAYKILVGKRAWFHLLTLEENEQVTRSLDIDLLTGNVYYSVDNHTGTGLAYYYDMNTTKVWNNRILRLIKNIRDEDLKPELPLKRALQKLPCNDWAEVLSIIPGFDMAMERRYDDLFLPHQEVTFVKFNGSDDSLPELPEAIELHLPSQVTTSADLSYTFQILMEGDTYTLHYENNTIGAEFFNEDEVYERLLSPKEQGWVASLAKEAGKSDADHEQIRQLLMLFLRRELEIIS
ncbi:MAG: hypothetical protein IJV59_05800 [Eubacterium sp.]|nr:hypothetical protein [Eubacterium sp.]MBQ9022907.1 hypothetical protein [Eubacterium sp.]